MPRLISNDVKKKILLLRRNGHSLNEITQVVKVAKSSVSRLVKEVHIEKKYRKFYESKKNKAQTKSKKEWVLANNNAKKIIGKLRNKDKLMILLGLYWGEGTKRELNLINGDPILVRCFLEFLCLLGVSKKDLKANLRIYKGVNEDVAKKYWSLYLDLPINCFGRTNFVIGGKINKLPNGMCRVRVAKGGKYFKLLISLIEVVKNEYSLRSSMDRTVAS